ncbi:MAG: M23 family metallopeptidase [Pseudomonadota bacterium]
MTGRSNIAVLVWFASFCLALGACASPRTGVSDYRNISPRWQISNSPLPIPSPKAKPKVYRASAPASRGGATWVPASTSSASGYRVRAGDTVYGLARRFNVPASQIIKANGLSKPYHLNQGQRIALSQSPPARPKVSAQQPKPRVVKASAKPRAKTYTVRRGDGLYAIARAKGVPASQLIRANKLRKPYGLRKGQVLVIPALAQGQHAKPVRVSPHAGRATFIWPAAGKVVSRYGVKADGLRNDGINIAAGAGDPVYAAASGEVIYAGDRLRAFGNLILVRHASGMVSAYAHVAKLMVVEGQQVRQGVQIATVGKTGLVKTPQLHFELRRDSQAIDPIRYLGRLQMASAGR